MRTFISYFKAIIISITHLYVARVQNRVYVQMRQTKPQLSWPAKEGFACPARISFKKWDEYFLIQGFPILEAMEVASKIDSRIPVVALRQSDAHVWRKK